MPVRQPAVCPRLYSFKELFWRAAFNLPFLEIVIIKGELVVQKDVNKGVVNSQSAVVFNKT